MHKSNDLLKKSNSEVCDQDEINFNFANIFLSSKQRKLKDSKFSESFSSNNVKIGQVYKISKNFV